MSATWSGRLWSTGECVTVTAKNGVISSISSLSSGEVSANRWIAPGLIDLQVNGVAGYSFNGDSTTAESVRCAVDALHREGITRFCPTIVTGTTQSMRAALSTLAAACDDDSTVEYAVLGIHVEGPFISPEDGPRGVHNIDWIRPPDWDEFLAWQDAAGGRIRMVTLAPELPGAMEFIVQLVANGVIASLGHSAASVQEIEEAIDAGATMATHLGNGSHPMIKRHPNYIWAQLAADRQWAGLIPDGFHLPPETLKVMIRAKGSKAILVSDASPLAKMPPGRYLSHHGTDVVLEPGGRLHPARSQDILAGSALTLRQGVQNVANFGILPLGEAINLASRHPAELFGIADCGVGALRVGGPADMVIYMWDDLDQPAEMVVVSTVSRGEVVYSG